MLWVRLEYVSMTDVNIALHKLIRKRNFYEIRNGINCVEKMNSLPAPAARYLISTERVQNMPAGRPAMRSANGCPALSAQGKGTALQPCLNHTRGEENWHRATPAHQGEGETLGEPRPGAEIEFPGEELVLTSEA